MKDIIKKQLHESFYTERIEDSINSFSDMNFKIVNSKKISIPNFTGTGGTYEFVRMEDGQFYITGLLFNGAFLSASVGHNDIGIFNAIDTVNNLTNNNNKVGKTVNRVKGKMNR